MLSIEKLAISRKRNLKIEPLELCCKRARLLDSQIESNKYTLDAANRGLKRKLKNQETENALAIIKLTEEDLKAKISHYKEVIERSEAVRLRYEKINGMRRAKVEFLKNYSARVEVIT